MVAIGESALRVNTTGAYNTAVGQESLVNNTTGSNNVAFGKTAGENNTEGGSNTYIGISAGDLITTGSYNTIIGKSADPSANNASNQIVIGYNATGQADNSVTLGNASVTAIYMAQDSGATVYAAGLNTGGTAITSNQVLFEGATDDAYEVILTVTDPTADRTITFPDKTGTVAMTSDITGASNLNGLTDVKTENSSFFIGNIPASTNNAYYNNSLGANALDAITTGDYNTAIGQEALETVSSGHKNTSVGAQSLRYVNTGDQNTSIGVYAGDFITTGSNNVIIGYQADPSANSASNQIVIGKGATGQGDNYAVIGNTDVTRVYMSQDGSAVIYANGTINSSDLRFKSLIQPVNLGLQFINKLNPVSYFKMSKSQYKGEEKNSETRYEYGLIAQEVDNILKESDPGNSIISKDEEGFLGMDYKQLIMPLIKSVQELSSHIEKLESEKSEEIILLKKEIELLKSMMKK